VIRRLGWSVVVVALVATGAYTLVYVYRWEWNRALFTAVLFVAAEIVLAVMVVVRRMRRLEEQIGASAAATRSLRHLQDTRPAHDHFAWLERSVSRTSVFITLLLGAGVLFSTLAWIIDRIARRTATPVLERGLARRLAPLAFPERPLVPDDEALVAEGGPYGRDEIDLYLGPRR
jgi:hypothetical protein